MTGGEVKSDGITLDPGATYVNETGDECLIFTSEHTHRDILRHVIAEIGDEVRLHVDQILGEMGL